MSGQSDQRSAHCVPEIEGLPGMTQLERDGEFVLMVSGDVGHVGLRFLDRALGIGTARMAAADWGRWRPVVGYLCPLWICRLTERYPWFVVVQS